MGLRLALPGSTGRLAPDQYFCVGIASHCSGPSAPCASNYARTFKRFSRSRAIRGRHAPPLGLHERSRARERNARPIARPLRVVWHRHLRSCPVHAVRRCPSSRVDAKQYLAPFCSSRMCGAPGSVVLESSSSLYEIEPTLTYANTTLISGNTALPLRFLVSTHEMLRFSFSREILKSTPLPGAMRVAWTGIPLWAMNAAGFSLARE